MTLNIFHPAVAAWFQQSFAAPTPAQAEAWPAIKASRNVLIAAPTGSGKTLAAFLSAIDALVRQGLDVGLKDETQIVYVSPLKALSNDIHRNLEIPLAGIGEVLRAGGLPEVNIRTWVRTGDTPAGERQRMGKRPPHIVVTTPESLYILLSSRIRPRHAQDDTRRNRGRNPCFGAEQTRVASLPLDGAAIVTLRGQPTEDRTIGNPKADRRGRTFLGRCGFGG